MLDLYPITRSVLAAPPWRLCRALALAALLLPLGAHAQFNYSPANAQNVAGTYTDITATGTAITTANTDDASSTARPIGFNFSFNGSTFTQFVFNTNGLIRLGSAPTSVDNIFISQDLTAGNTNVDPIFSTDPADVNIIAPFNIDLGPGTGAGGAQYRYQTTGTAGSRVTTIQWKNVSDKPGTGTDLSATQYANFSFQAKLYEGTNNIEFVYGPVTAGTGAAGPRFPNVGIKGSTTTASVLANKTTSSALWSTTVFINGPYTTTTHNFRSNVAPDLGRTYRFTPFVGTDAAVEALYSLGKLPIPQGVPHIVTAVVTNLGGNTLTALPVTLTVSGVTTFTNTKTVASLAPGATTVVTFNGYSPTAAGTNTLTVTASATGDSNPANNAQTWTQTVTTNAFRYAAAGRNDGGIGFGDAANPGTSEGTILVKHTAATATTVTNVKVWLTNPETIGETVYGVVVSSTGTILGQTTPYVVQAADTGTYKTFTFVTPVAVPAGDFYAGLAQTANGTTDYSPMGTQIEAPQRTGAYFISTLAGGTVPTDLTTFSFEVRFMIEVTVAAPNTCTAPANFALGTVATTTAAFSYGAVSGALGYTLIYGPAGFDPATSGTSVNVTSTTPTLSGLTTTTTYDVYVRTRCTSTNLSNLSAPLTFTTSCVAPVITLPYVENFDAQTGATLPCGWSQINADGDTSRWRLSTLAPNSTPRSMTIRWTEPGITQDDWAITPGITLAAGQSVDVSFNYRAGTASFINSLELKAGRSATVAGMVTSVFNAPSYSGLAYRPGTGTFTATTAGTYYFGFHAYSAADQERTWIDDLSITNSPTCRPPTLVTALGSTQTTGTVTFTAGGANASGYTLVYGPAGFNPATAGTTLTPTGSPVTLSGLTASTAYDVYLTARCGATDLSTRVGPVSFTTVCGTAARTLPYTENFDGVSGGNVLPCGITIINANADTARWRNVRDATVLQASAPNQMRITTVTGTDAKDDWFVTPGIQLAAGQSVDLSFRYRNGDTPPEALEVRAGRAATVAGLTTPVFSDANLINTTYQTGTGTFTATTAGAYFFGFHTTSNAAGFRLYVDDISIIAAPTCRPPTQLTAVGTSQTAGSVSFVPGAANASGYTLVYGPAGFNPATAGTTLTPTGSPVTLSGLTASTTYDVYLTARCGATDLSTRVGPVSFSTLCGTAPRTLPYLETFEGGPGVALPCGWSKLNLDGDTAQWRVTDLVVKGYGATSGTKGAFITWTAPGITQDDWLISGGIALTAGQVVNLSFRYRGGNTANAWLQNLEVKAGRAATVAGLTTPVFSDLDFVYETYQTGTGTFTATTAGTYYIGFHSTSAPDQFTIALDDVSLSSPCSLPTIATTAPTAICPGGSVALTASGVTGATYQFLLGGQPISGATGSTYTATQAGTYTVLATAGACATTSTTSVTVTVNPAPAAPTTTPAARCGTGSVTLTASGAGTGDSYTWYAAATGGTALVTGAAYTTPSLSTTTTYYVSIRNAAGCDGPRTAAVATINAAPAPTLTAGSTTTFCTGGSVTLTAAGGGTGATYQFLLGGQPISGATGTSYVATQSGPYSVTATAGTCTGTSAALTVTVNPAPAAPTTTPAARCGTGSVTLTASGAGTGDSYTWYAAATGGTALVTGAAYTTPSLSTTTTYYVSIRNAAGCDGPRTAAVATINAAPAPTLTADAATTFCAGESVTLTAAGGGTGATYQFLLGGQPISGAAGTSYVATQSGPYSVTATDGTCTGTSAALTVTVNPAPAAPTTTPAARCGTGSVTLTAFGAPTGGRYAWYTQPTGGTAISGVFGASYSPTVSVTTTYYVSAASAANCESGRTPVVATVNAQPAPSLTAGGPTTFCDGGAVTLTAAAGGPGATYQFLLNGQPISGATGTSYFATQTGLYTVTATTPSCAGTSSAVSVTATPLPSADFAYATSTFCLSGANPTPAITGATGGTFSSTNGLSLDATTGQINLSASAAGTYLVTYTLTSPCPATATQSVTVTTAPSASFTYPTGPAPCAGSAATLTPTLGTGASAGTFSATPTGLSIDPVTGAVDVSLSAAGTYTISNNIAASGTCLAASATATLTIAPGATATLAAGGNTTFCAGGSVTLTAGGSGTFQFLLNGQPVNGTTATTLVATQAGDYTVTATATGGCSATSSTVTVVVNAVPTATIAYPASSFCLGGANPTPTITGPAGGTFSAPTGLTIDPGTGAVNLAASAVGSYLVTYTLAGPCPATATQTVSLTAPATAAFAYPAAALCAGGTGTAQPQVAPGATLGQFSSTPAGLNLDAATGNITASTSVAGTYAVTNTVTGTGGCADATSTTNVTIEAAPTAALTASGSLTFCAGDSVTLTASGGATYQFLLNGQPINGTTATTLVATQAGDYAVTATSAAGCAATATPLTVVVNAVPSAAFAYANATICLSGTNPAPVVTGAAGGTFSAPTGLTLDAATGAIDLATSVAGNYLVTYTVAGPCPATATQTVSLTAPATAAFAYPAAALCAGGTGTAQPQVAPGATLGQFSSTPAGLNLDAATGNITASTSVAGTYAVTNTVTGTGGCADATSTTNVTIEAAPTAALTASGSLTFCAGDSVTLTASGGATYQFLLNGQPINGTTATTLVATQAGDYTVTATSAAGCAATATPLTVVVNAVPSAAFAYANTTICLSGTNPAPVVTGAAGGTFSAPTGLTLDAATGAIDLATSVAGNYLVTYTVAGPCPATATQTVSLTTAAAAGFSYPGTVDLCAGTVQTVVPTLVPGASPGAFSSSPAGLTLDPVTGAITVATSAAGIYTVTNDVTGGAGCGNATATTTITLLAAPTAGLTASGSLTFCAGDSVTLTASGGATYQFLLNGQPLPGTSGATITVDQAGDYTVTVTNAGGCSATSATLSVTVNAVPAAPVVTSQTLPSGVVELTSSAATGNQWSFNGTLIAGATAPTYLVTAAAQSGNYCVTTTSAAGCPSVPACLNVIVTGTAAALPASLVQLAPNPTLDGRTALLLTVPAATSYRLLVVDATGRTVVETVVPRGATHHELDLRPLPTGVYAVRLLTPEGTVVRRMVRQ